MQKEKNTAAVLQELLNASSLGEGLHTISANQENFINLSFKEFFDQYLAEHDALSIADIVKRSGISRQYGYAILGGEKKASRDRIIALCFAAGMSFKEVDHGLLYAGHSQLHSRNKRDATIIVAFNTWNSSSRKPRTTTELNIFLDEHDLDPLDI